MKRFTTPFLLLLTLAFLSFDSPKKAPITPATALQSYLTNGDKTYQWELKDSFEMGDVKAYNLLLTSQKWREHTWRHQLTILVPKENKYDGSLLFITGGSNKNEQPNWNAKGQEDKVIKGLVDIATKNKAIVTLLKQAPNQPLYDNLTEDALISYTLHQFKKDGDYTWPLLFPMVKSAVRAMDAVQEFAKQTLKHDLNRFVVSGASKRGWTTWLTGANDKRVVAIAPMVIDILNMPVSLDYQVKVWKDYSVQIEDYVKLGIPQTAKTESGNAINTMVDPYSYRKNLTMPKMIFMGTNDEYWVVDNIKNYFDDIPGENLIHYVPNAGHSLGDGKSAFEGLGAFFGMTMAKKPYPVCKWNATSTKKGVDVSIKTTADALVDVIVWSANSPDTDFRNETWTSKSLGVKNKAKVDVSEAYPASGYHAFYVDLKYANPNGGTYTESTRMFVSDNDEVFLKPSSF
ncbi:PhoPQ-activated pathogenicity-related family protein [Larkinella sp. C7]|jgi:PhoPQ-activated pathogenicity-related protein|uniref:PhoPQ-activated pathogenicity-related family protein n=1 Tax=Larkinella sp. C7 TaxID=2576607 RepID=UPI0011110C24|nr:PhoPQ-activated protein PqaA family protein [Larkinella sp. C7]